MSDPLGLRLWRWQDSCHGLHHRHSSHTALVGTRNRGLEEGSWGRPFLEVRVSAAPADGAANEQVIKLLAKALGLSKSGVIIVSGRTSRLKRIEVPLDVAEVRALLGG